MIYNIIISPASFHLYSSNISKMGTEKKKQNLFGQLFVAVYSDKEVTHDTIFVNSG